MGLWLFFLLLHVDSAQYGRLLLNHLVANAGFLRDIRLLGLCCTDVLIVNLLVQRVVKSRVLVMQLDKHLLVLYGVATAILLILILVMRLGTTANNLRWKFKVDRAASRVQRNDCIRCIGCAGIRL